MGSFPRSAALHLQSSHILPCSFWGTFVPAGLNNIKIHFVGFFFKILKSDSCTRRQHAVYETEIPQINISNFLMHQSSCYIVFRQGWAKLSIGFNSRWIFWRKKQKKQLIFIFSSKWSLDWELVPEACLLVSQSKSLLKRASNIPRFSSLDSCLDWYQMNKDKFWIYCFSIKTKRKIGTSQKLMHFVTRPFSLFAVSTENMWNRALTHNHLLSSCYSIDIMGKKVKLEIYDIIHLWYRLLYSFTVNWL